MQVINTIYNNINSGCEYINRFPITIPESKNFNKKLLNLHNTIYFPDEIQNYIKSHIHYITTYIVNISGKNIHINLYTTSKYSNTKIHNIIFKIILIIYVLNLYASPTCSKNMKIDIYFTPFKRKLPRKLSDILEPINVNGGFSTSGCRNSTTITIYREEDWYKVFVHELFHNLNLDFAIMNIDKWREILERKFEKINHIQSEFKIYETYCETWARILNVAINSYLINLENRNRQKFLSTFRELIAAEQLFSLIQSFKIYKRMHSNIPYIERSNIICYYVFTAALMNNYTTFLNWAKRQGGINFEKTNKNVNSFFNLIWKEYTNPDFLNKMKKTDKIKLGKYTNSLRMILI
jgi:hypothetical protein